MTTLLRRDGRQIRTQSGEEVNLNDLVCIGTEFMRVYVMGEAPIRDLAISFGEKKGADYIMLSNHSITDNRYGVYLATLYINKNAQKSA